MFTSSPYSPSLLRSPFAPVDDTSPIPSPRFMSVPLETEEDSDAEPDRVLVGRFPLSSPLRSSNVSRISHWTTEDSDPMARVPMSATTTFSEEEGPFTPRIERNDAMIDLARKLNMLDLAAKEAQEVAANSPRHTPHHKYAPLVPPDILSTPSTTTIIPHILIELERRPMDWEYTPSPSAHSRSQSRSSFRRSHPPTPQPVSPPPLPRNVYGRTSVMSSAIVPRKKKTKKAKKPKGPTKKPGVVEYAEQPIKGISVDTYDEAVNSITWLMSHPKSVEDILSSPKGKLLFCQALLVEFGVCPDLHPLPTSHGAARSLLQKMVHINIADYIECRGRGKEALRSRMLASNSALRRDLMSKKRRVPLGEVKRRGLRMLLANNCWQ
ncbi:hypothetical protein DACRYDRAFT_19975 [Dacryopinax primogenitus]|uniref:Uncharacterized protein n=1 Tax=Dacryopinax primogenitus (strain DJM 731) TaxID=1858805 RepID=M5GGI1_DACPD|nr:uncharacterized protein DACRYDRAFT_19975 [Dacryopinax primogenitus]EJU05528.1 hypothetical protein DACRYDRAFT_19975 [Dacryopinax primogenitus]